MGRGGGGELSRRFQGSLGRNPEGTGLHAAHPSSPAAWLLDPCFSWREAGLDVKGYIHGSQSGPWLHLNDLSQNRTQPGSPYGYDLRQPWTSEIDDVTALLMS